jgi:hypothetical protein
MKRPCSLKTKRMYATGNPPYESNWKQWMTVLNPGSNPNNDWEQSLQVNDYGEEKDIPGIP